VSSCVLDASAVLALLHKEPGADTVAEKLPNAVISTVNLAEVVTKLVDAGMPLEEARNAVDTLGLRYLSFEATTAFQVGGLRKQTRALGLSLGDRACLATGAEQGVPVVTAERSWGNLTAGVDVELIR
jgi:PIN domain nuclease of toxin-antitoxin system